jgi:hypothetical protein
MSAFHNDWIVSEHGALEEVTDGILTVQATIKMPLGHFPRRMTVVRLANGGSAIWSGIPLDRESMKRLEAAGKPHFLIVPNAHHRLDIRAWKARYPDALVLAPDGARRVVEEACPVEGNQTALSDPDARLVIVEGTGNGEFAFHVKRAEGTTLIVNDIIAYVAHPHGMMAKLMARIMGFGVHEPQTPRVIKRMLIKDKRALASQLSHWSREKELRRIIPSHGDIIANASETLSRLAQEIVR